MTHFITEKPFPDVKRHKSDAKIHAGKHDKVYSKALNDLTRTRFPFSQKSNFWDDFQRVNTAKLHLGGIITTRLENDLPLEVRLAGFQQDLSDFTEDAALTKIEITASAATHDHPDFRIVCNVNKATSSKSAVQPLAQFFDASKNAEPLRERIGPFVKSLKAHVPQMLTEWETWTPQAVRLSPSSDDTVAIQAAETMIDHVLKMHGPTEAVWASKAVLAALPTVPVAWLMILKFNGKHPRKEFVRIVECALAACDFAYGLDFNIPQIGDLGLVTAIDTFLELGQFAAALNNDVMDNSELAEIGLNRNLNAVLSRRFPATIMGQSQVLTPASS
jgi:hypothetical protein